MAKTTCSIEACEKPRYCRGWCETHYTRWRLHGDPTFYRGVSQHADVRVQFMERVQVDESGCWLWIGRIDPGTGYGQLYLRGEGQKLAHRVAYEWFVGPIPDGLHIDHVRANGCRNRHCVNWIDHLEPVTPRENVLRSPRPPYEVCSEGHAFTGDNIYVYPGTGKRRCMECLRTARQRSDRERRARLRAQRANPMPVYVRGHRVHKRPVEGKADGYWFCSCGKPLAATRTEARSVMVGHRLAVMP